MRAWLFSLRLQNLAELNTWLEKLIEVEQADRLVCSLYERTSLIITTNLSFSEWIQVFADAKMMIALLDCITHHCETLKTSNESCWFKHRNQV